jgi:hypothetical protein
MRYDHDLWLRSEKIRFDAQGERLAAKAARSTYTHIHLVIIVIRKEEMIFEEFILLTIGLLC